MIVNIKGKGTSGPIPGVGELAPVYNYDATETLVRRLLNYTQWSVYEASTGRLITKTNVDSFFSSNSSSSGGGGSSGGGSTTPTVTEVNWKVLP